MSKISSSWLKFIKMLSFSLIFNINCNIYANIIDSGHLEVDKKVEIYYETYGTKNGRPIIFLHGGPGSGLLGTKKNITKFFDLEKDYVILFDQRGAGSSKPNGVFKENNTNNIVDDIDKLRQHLNLKKVSIWGHSWGSTIGFLYAAKYYKNINELYLSGIYLGSNEENDFLFNGIRKHFPKEFDNLINFITSKGIKVNSSEDIIKACYDIIFDENYNILEKKELIKIFSILENCSSSILLKKESFDIYSSLKISDINDNDLNRAKIFFYFLKNNAFIESKLLDDKLKIQNISKISKIRIFNSRYDMVTPPFTAYKLHLAIPKSEFFLIEGAGHVRTDEKNIEIIKNFLSNNALF